MADNAKAQIENIVDSVGVRAISRISIALLIPISLWGLTKLSDMHDAVVSLQTQMTERTSDRYSGEDARRDGVGYLNLISRNQSDIAAVAARQSKDEEFLYQHMPRH